MLKHNSSTIQSNSYDNKISGSVRIKAGSFVIDNQWVSYDNYLFKLDSYIKSAISTNRPYFFKNRSNALYLIVALSLKDGIKIIEGEQVKYTTRDSVPLPGTIGVIPLVGIIVRQDGTNDLNYGYIPILDSDIKFFSGTGNIENKNLVGITGMNNTSSGITGIQGTRGATGFSGVTGIEGDFGITGSTGAMIQGETGVQGMTGISWDVHLPFEENI